MPASGGATRRWTSSCGPTRSRSSSTASGSPPRRRRWAATAATTRGPRRAGLGRDPPRRARRQRDRRRRGQPRIGHQRLAADHLRLRQDLHLLHRAVQPRAGAEPAVRRDRGRGARASAAAGYREVTLLGQNVNRYGHDLAPEARFGHVRTARTVGPPPGPRGPAGPRRADPRDRRAPDRGRRARDPAPALRHLAPVGPVRPPDRGDGRVPVGVRGAPPAGPVGDDAMLRRMGRQYTIEHYLERLARIREAVPGIALSTDVIVGFCGETEAEFEATLRLLEAVRYDQVFAAAYCERPGTPATQPRRRRAGGREAPAARSTCSRSRRRSGWSGTGRGSGGRPRCWSTRSCRPSTTITMTTRPRAPPSRATRSRACRTASRTSPAARARTSSSTSPGRRISSGDWSASASSTRARTRCAGQLA